MKISSIPISFIIVLFTLINVSIITSEFSESISIIFLLITLKKISILPSSDSIFIFYSIQPLSFIRDVPFKFNWFKLFSSNCILIIMKYIFTDWVFLVEHVVLLHLVLFLLVFHAHIYFFIEDFFLCFLFLLLLLTIQL